MRIVCGSFIDTYIDAGLAFGNLIVQEGGGATIDRDLLAQGGVCPPSAITGGNIRIGAMGVMDWNANIGGLIISDAVVGCTTTSGGAGGAIWGTTASAGAVGVDVRAGGTLRYLDSTKLTITGPGGDFRLANSLTGRAWNEAGSTYTAAIALTWAGLAGALLDNVHNLERNAHVYKNVGGSTAAAQP